MDNFEEQRIAAQQEMQGYVERRVASPRRHPMTEPYFNTILNGGPDIWHGAVLGWNSDDGYVPLRWIMRQPACDVATSRYLFHYLDVPGFAPEFDKPDLDPQRHEYVLIARELWQRISAGLYTRSEIAFEPRPGMVPLTIERVKRMSPAMLQPIAGREVHSFDMDMGPDGKFWPGHKPW